MTAAVVILALAVLVLAFAVVVLVVIGRKHDEYRQSELATVLESSSIERRHLTNALIARSAHELSTLTSVDHAYDKAAEREAVSYEDGPPPGQVV